MNLILLTRISLFGYFSVLVVFGVNVRLLSFRILRNDRRV